MIGQSRYLTFSATAVAGSRIVVPSPSGYLAFALDDGRELWSARLGDKPITSSPTVVNGAFCVGSDEGEVVAFRARRKFAAPMTYVLVILRARGHAANEQLHARAHERFISSLIERNLVLLCGVFAEPVGDAYAAYLVRRGGIDEAREIAAEDPFVARDVVRPEDV